MNPLVSLLWIRGLWKWAEVISEATRLPKLVSFALIWIGLAVVALLLTNVLN